MFAAEILQQVVVGKRNFLYVCAFSCFIQNIFQPLKYGITVQIRVGFYHVDLSNAIDIDSPVKSI
jgi:hypothetical protein